MIFRVNFYFNYGTLKHLQIPVQSHPETFYRLSCSFRFVSVFSKSKSDSKSRSIHSDKEEAVHGEVLPSSESHA